MKRIPAVMLALAILLSIVHCQLSIAASPTDVQVTYTESRTPLADLTQKNVVFDNGDFAWFRRFEFKTTGDRSYVTAVSIPGKSGTVRWYDEDQKKWRTAPLNGKLPDAMLFIDTDSYHMIISQPYAYKPFGRGSLEDKPRLPITAEVRADGKIELTMRFMQVKGQIGDIWALQSSEPLIEWTPGNEFIWSSYARTGGQRWCYDGFYSTSPANYNPTSKNMFFRNPAAWLVNGFVRTGGSRASRDLGWAMCDAMIGWQNKQGFWPTEPESGWLKADYGIGPGFYDTRFNNDFTYALFDAAKNYGDSRFLDAAVKQADFLVWLAENHSYTFSGPDGVGLLVEDYYHPDGHNKTHSSLNHMLQEIKTLYRAHEATGDDRYLETGDALLRGIKLTRDRWIMPSGSLEYAYMPNGSMGLSDYPYLTYNDLFELQEMLAGMDRGRDADLRVLMSSKRRWMDANGVTGYKK